MRGEERRQCCLHGGGGRPHLTQKKSDRSQFAVVTAVGGALPDSAYEHKAAAALARSGVSVSAVVTGERFLSIFVPREESDRALRIVHDALIAAE